VNIGAAEILLKRNVDTLSVRLNVKMRPWLHRAVDQNLVACLLDSVLSEHPVFFAEHRDNSMRLRLVRRGSSMRLRLVQRCLPSLVGQEPIGRGNKQQSDAVCPPIDCGAHQSCLATLVRGVYRRVLFQQKLECGPVAIFSPKVQRRVPRKIVDCGDVCPVQQKMMYHVRVAIGGGHAHRRAPHVTALVRVATRREQTHRALRVTLPRGQCEVVIVLVTAVVVVIAR
jgi:hypothetical protein